MSVFNQSRSTIIKLIFTLAFLILLVRLFQLQVLSRDYGAQARGQAYIQKITWPERGLFLDRNGKAMVKNISAFDLQVTLNAIKGMDTLSFCRIMGIDTSMFREKIEKLGKKYLRNIPCIYQALLPYDILAKFEEKQYSFPGFELIQRTERNYPYNMGGNVFGYLNEVDSGMIARSNNYLRPGDFGGMSGLERFYDKILRGERGVEIFIRDGKQRIVDKYKNGKYDTIPTAGRSLKTFMDVKVQQLAEKLMKNKLGAAVAIEPKTGGIIAMATGPGYDPNLLTGAKKNAVIGELNQDVTMPMFNFAIKGMYPPGSTFKPLGALVALDEGIMTPSDGVGCSGRYRACGGKGVACHGGGHAGNLRNAMAASCNSYFITAFRKALDNTAYTNVQAGYAKWREYMFNFGLGHKLGIDMPGEWAGNIPDTAKLRKQIGFDNWSSCTISTMGIGQDRMLTTPLQMANTMCIIANKGHYYIPHFVDSIVGETKNDTALGKYRKKITPLHIPDSSYEAVFDGMEAVVTSGTARRSAIKGIAMCGKTGTSENYFKGKKQEEHSWFVCFAPKENPKIAVAVVVLNSGQGGQFAAPIASLMVEQFLTDTVKRKALEDQMANKKIFPAYLKEIKYIQDSTKAYDKFEETGDSVYIRPYLPPPPPPVVVLNKDSLAKVENLKAEKLKEEEKKKAEKNEKEKDAGTLPKKTDIDKPKEKDSLKKRK